MEVKISMGKPKAPPRKFIHIHGCFTYTCQKCGNGVNMYLEMGVEEQCNKRLLAQYKSGLEHKPTPFVIRCPYCNEISLSHSKTSFLHRPITMERSGYSYFAYGNGECATPHFSKRDLQRGGK